MPYVKFNNGQITKQSTSEDTDNSAITQKILNISEKISVISEKVSDISKKLSNPVISVYYGMIMYIKIQENIY